MRLHRLIATCFYIGSLPKAPGTFGSAFGVFLYVLFLSFHPTDFHLLILILALFFLGVFSSNLICRQMSEKDPSEIVIDEVVGVFIALFQAPKSFGVIFLGFLLFRLFDIWKPYPIRKLEHLPRGWGVMADDVLAGIYANLILRFFF